MDAKSLVDILMPLIGRERLHFGFEMGHFVSYGNQAGKSTGKYAVLKDVRERPAGLVELETEHEGRRTFLVLDPSQVVKISWEEKREEQQGQYL